MSEQSDVKDEYVSRPGQKNIVPVTKDDEEVEQNIDAEEADSDKQLERDEANAIDKSNIIESRLRGGKPAKGAMAEPGDEEGLPTDD